MAWCRIHTLHGFRLHTGLLHDQAFRASDKFLQLVHIDDSSFQLVDLFHHVPEDLNLFFFRANLLVQVFNRCVVLLAKVAQAHIADIALGGVQSGHVGRAAIVSQQGFFLHFAHLAVKVLVRLL